MAAIDWILNETDYGLIKLYNFIAAHAFEPSSNFTNWHPSGIKYCSVYKYLNNYKGISWERHPYRVYSPTSLFILNEIIKRWENSSFYNSCWWEAKTKDLLCTRLSILSVESTSVGTSEKEENKKEEIVYNEQSYTLIGTGLKRKVYLSSDKTYVVKIPMINLGYDENKVEAETYAKNTDSHYAKCELLPDGNLKMEYVKPAFLTKSDDIPDWVYTIAEAQVGYNLNGILVAYDYGSEI